MSTGTGRSLAMLPWFVRDYIAATRHLSLAERGAYTDLLFLSWEHGPLPVDPARLARMVGCGADEFSQVWLAIAGKFIETPTGLVNRRLEEHRREAERRSGVARAKAERRWNHRTESAAADAAAFTAADALADAAADATASPQQMPGACHPYPYPYPYPESRISFGDPHPLARTRERPPYEQPDFHDQVIAAYHDLLSDLPKVRDWNERRRRKLNARIAERVRAGKPADQVSYWRDLFSKVAASRFLRGDKTDWRCPGLEWLLEPRNFIRLIEGAYDDPDGR